MGEPSAPRHVARLMGVHEDAPVGYEIFNKKQDDCVKVVLKAQASRF